MTASGPVIDFWFDFISPYAYFASLEIETLARRHGRDVRWRPMLLGVSVLQTMGLKPLMETPLKSDYVVRDLRRTARRTHAALNRDLHRAPMNPVPAARVLAWLDANRRDVASGFARIVFDRYWSECEDMDQAGTLQTALRDAGLGPVETEQAMAREPAADLLRQSVADAIAIGVFGSPFVVVDGEPFWGHDRFSQIDDWLRLGGW